MGDYFERDEVTRDFDSGIARRILGYLKPYRAAVALVLVTLVLGTAGELALPVVVRHVVDRALMPSWYAMDPRALTLPEGRRLEPTAADPRIAGKVYLPSSRFAALTAVERGRLGAQGLLDTTPRYVLRIDPSDAAQAATLAAVSADLERDGAWASITLDRLHRLGSREAASLRKADAAILSSSAAFLAVALVLVLVASFLQTFGSNLVGQRIMKVLRMELFTRVTTRSLAFLSRQPVGRLVTRMTSDVETINQFFTDVVAAFLKDASVLVGVLVVLIVLDPRLGLIVTATLPLVLVVAGKARTSARDAFRRQRRWTSRVNAFISERLSGIAVVKLFVREEASRREFERHDQELMKANLGEMYVYATFRPLVDFCASLTTAVVLFFGANLLRVHLLSLGTLIAFVNLVRMFYSPIMDMSEKYTLLQSAMAGGERVFALLDELDPRSDAPGPGVRLDLRGHIEFDHVWFAYSGEDWVLRDLSFTVSPGESVAIVGYTGAGKTTIANLMTRLWDVQRGTIRVDGRAVADLPLGGLRRAIQPVLQEVFLFSGSVAENIRLGDEVSVEAMRRAAEAVHAGEFIEAMEGGYQAMLSEGAGNISQGQRQLISFARVLAHDPAVIILDEATSSVDTETEGMIQRGMEALLHGRTNVVIAHRLSTIRHADRILVLSGGRIVEEGRHAELIEKRGLYWNLYQLQYGGGEA
ncbi:MAG TPA: ABC transporter ATP-binding protein [Rectinemataceae bacterium]|nr:ABC transporter ATP-binding protein [Rectinemataceae bacterium]